MRSIVIGALALAGLVSPALAGTPFKETKTCPVGGEKFEHLSTGSFSTMGSRPDGKPYGSWQFPMPIPVCPSNKLPIYKEFSVEELARLGPLVASEGFRGIADDVPYYRAAWLMEQTGEEPAKVAWMIVKASWEADGDAMLKRKYQDDYVKRLLALPKGSNELEWLWLQARAANGLRETERFAEASQAAEKLIPQARLALDAARQRPPQKDIVVTDIESAEGLIEYLQRLVQVASTGNKTAEPIAMIPGNLARYICKERKSTLPQSDQAACDALPPSRY